MKILYFSEIMVLEFHVHAVAFVRHDSQWKQYHFVDKSLKNHPYQNDIPWRFIEQKIGDFDRGVLNFFECVYIRM